MLLVGGLAFALWHGRDPAPSGASGTDEVVPAEPGPATPGLQGAGGARVDAPADDGPPADIRALVERTRSTDPDVRDAAAEALKARHATTPFPLRWFVRWALLEIPDGQSNPLVGWAIAELEKQPDAVKPFVAEILQGALGAGEKTQEAIGRLIVALSGGAYGSGKVLTKEHMPILVRIYEAEGSTYGLKRSLVDLLERLGPDAASLAPALVGYVKEILADRRVAAKEAAEAGIMVSWDHVEYTIERVLSAMGSAAVPKILELLRAMYDAGRKDEDGWFDDPTGILAGALAGAGEEGIRALLQLARDPRARVRSDVAWALRDVKGPHEAVRGALLDLLTDEDADIRQRAAETLAEHGPSSIPELLRAMRDTDARVRRAAIKSLGALGVEPDDVMAQLLAMLENEDRWTALQAANTLAGFGKDGIVALPAILARMDTDDARIARGLGEAAARLVVHAPEQLPPAWAKASPHGRHAYLVMLVTLAGPDPGGRPRTLDPRLAALRRQALADPDAGVRIEAAAQLATTAEPRVIEILRTGFDAKQGPRRARATEGLALVGAPVADLLPRLIARLGARESLWRPGPAEPLEPGYDEAFVIGDAIADLGRFDLPRMLPLLGVENWELSYAAQEAFDGHGVEGLRFLETAYDGMRAVQKKEALEVGRSAFFKQGADAPERHEAARALIRKGLADPSPAVRLEAVKALRKDAAQRAALTLPVLIALLDEENDEIRSSAAYQLSSLGKAAAPARGDIEARLPGLPKDTARTLRKLLETLDGKDAPK